MLPRVTRARGKHSWARFYADLCQEDGSAETSRDLQKAYNTNDKLRAGFQRLFGVDAPPVHHDQQTQPVETQGTMQRVDPQREAEREASQIAATFRLSTSLSQSETTCSLCIGEALAYRLACGHGWYCATCICRAAARPCSCSLCSACTRSWCAALAVSSCSRHRHRRRRVHCAGMRVPVLKMTALRGYGGAGTQNDRLLRGDHFDYRHGTYPRNGHAVGDADM